MLNALQLPDVVLPRPPPLVPGQLRHVHRPPLRRHPTLAQLARLSLSVKTHVFLPARPASVDLSHLQVRCYVASNRVSWLNQYLWTKLMRSWSKVINLRWLPFRWERDDEFEDALWMDVLVPSMWLYIIWQIFYLVLTGKTCYIVHHIKNYRLWFERTIVSMTLYSTMLKRIVFPSPLSKIYNWLTLQRAFWSPPSSLTPTSWPPAATWPRTPGIRWRQWSPRPVTPSGCSRGTRRSSIQSTDSQRYESLMGKYYVCTGFGKCYQHTSTYHHVQWFNSIL